ncbi:MAG: hypothetical protein D6776_11835 [Planctomycetota bacterium]|nr:MAG: hypothetical protein D6776_11835 [Planctomycetota bacterium]
MRKGARHPELDEREPPRLDPRLFGELGRSAFRWTLLSLATSFGALTVAALRGWLGAPAPIAASARPALVGASVSAMLLWAGAERGLRAIRRDRTGPATRATGLAVIATATLFGCELALLVRPGLPAPARVLLAAHLLYTVGAAPLAVHALWQIGRDRFWSLHHPSLHYLALHARFLLACWLVLLAIASL